MQIMANRKITDMTDEIMNDIMEASANVLTQMQNQHQVASVLGARSISPRMLNINTVFQTLSTQDHQE